MFFYGTVCFPILSKIEKFLLVILKGVDSSVPLMRHDPNDLGSLILIIPKKRTLTYEQERMLSIYLHIIDYFLFENTTVICTAFVHDEHVYSVTEMNCLKLRLK